MWEMVGYGGDYVEDGWCEAEVFALQPVERSKANGPSKSKAILHPVVRWRPRTTPPKFHQNECSRCASDQSGAAGPGSDEFWMLGCRQRRGRRCTQHAGTCLLQIGDRRSPHSGPSRDHWCPRPVSSGDPTLATALVPSESFFGRLSNDSRLGQSPVCQGLGVSLDGV